MDEDTFIAIRALHNAFVTKYVGDEVGDSWNGKEQHHPSIEYAAYKFMDAGDDSQHQERYHYPTIESTTESSIESSNYHDASSSIHRDASYGIET